MGWKSELPEIGPVGLQPASSFRSSCVCAPIALRCFGLQRITLLTVALSRTWKNVSFLKVDRFILRDENHNFTALHKAVLIVAWQQTRGRQLNVQPSFTFR